MDELPSRALGFVPVIDDSFQEKVSVFRFLFTLTVPDSSPNTMIFPLSIATFLPNSVIPDASCGCNSYSIVKLLFEISSIL